MGAKSYHELIVWQKSIDLVTEIYQLVKLLPEEETYALSNQMRRAAISIPSNIAEGQQRRTTKDFVNFLSIAKGSNAELQTQLIICVRIGYLSNQQTITARNLSNEISKMLSCLSDALLAEKDD